MKPREYYTSNTRYATEIHPIIQNMLKNNDYSQVKREGEDGKDLAMPDRNANLQPNGCGCNIF